VLQNYVRQAVAEANSSQNSNEMIELLKQQNELLIAMLQKDTSLKIDGREFGRMVNKYA
jgi:cell shape-determining protein MreC